MMEGEPMSDGTRNYTIKLMLLFVCSVIGTAPCWQTRALADEVRIYSSRIKVIRGAQPATSLFIKLEWFNPTNAAVSSYVIGVPAGVPLGVPQCLPQNPPVSLAGPGRSIPVNVMCQTADLANKLFEETIRPHLADPYDPVGREELKGLDAKLSNGLSNQARENQKLIDDTRDVLLRQIDAIPLSVIKDEKVKAFVKEIVLDELKKDRRDPVELKR
jgi:hypothetical protein